MILTKKDDEGMMTKDEGTMTKDEETKDNG